MGEARAKNLAFQDSSAMRFLRTGLQIGSVRLRNCPQCELALRLVREIEALVFGIASFAARYALFREQG